MRLRRIGLSALLALILMAAPAGTPVLGHLGWPISGVGRALASEVGGSRARGPTGDEPRPPTGDVRDFGLVSETEGWLLTGAGLYRTETGGRSWRDISPADAAVSVLAVFWLDASRGRAVTRASESAGPADYALARTADGGSTWESTPLRLSPQRPGIAPAQALYLYFVDANTGWLVIKHASGSNFSVGSLFRTSDGGNTWTPLAIPIGEPVYFLTDAVGWTAGGAAGNELYRTADGGESWQPQDVAAGSASADQQRFYRLPRFWNTQEGLLPVVAAGEQPRLDLYATHDGGEAWEPAAQVPLPRGTTSADGLPLTLIPAARAAIVLPDAGSVVMASARGALTAATIAPQDSAGRITRLEMASSNAGWALQTAGTCAPSPPAPGQARPGSGPVLDCRSETALVATVDGGRTWTRLPLPAMAAAIDRLDGLTFAAQTPGAAGFHTAVLAGQGFDKCEVATIAQLGQWIGQSPYRAVNLYIGGASRACSNNALNASLVSTLGKLGWRFIPTWVGPQAPCYPYDKTLMSADPAIARAQGMEDANAAADAAAGLGLARPDGSGAIVYYDMEHYDTTDAACHEAVRAFISGWTGQLHARGSLAAVYANGPPLSTFTTLSDVPDAIWPAHWVSSAYDPSATVWDVYRLSNDLWSNHQRIRQYAGGHVETWGDVSLNIDCDVIDGIVATIELPGYDVYLPLILNEGPSG